MTSDAPTDRVRLYPAAAFPTGADEWTQRLRDVVKAHVIAQNRLLDLACEAALLYSKGVRVQTRNGIWTSIEVTGEVPSGEIHYTPTG